MDLTPLAELSDSTRSALFKNLLKTMKARPALSEMQCVVSYTLTGHRFISFKDSILRMFSLFSLLSVPPSVSLRICVVLKHLRKPNWTDSRKIVPLRMASVVSPLLTKNLFTCWSVPWKVRANSITHVILRKTK